MEYELTDAEFCRTFGQAIIILGIVLIVLLYLSPFSEVEKLKESTAKLKSLGAELLTEINSIDCRINRYKSDVLSQSIEAVLVKSKNLAIAIESKLDAKLISDY